MAKIFLSPTFLLTFAVIVFNLNLIFNMKPTLFLLAAGMGSRYGGLKQLDGLGPNGETIMDYSIYDAIKAATSKTNEEQRAMILSETKGLLESITFFIKL